MIKMNVVNAQVQEIQKRCGNDKQRYNQELQKFYAENNVNPLGGCGWSLLPIVFIYPLYAIIRRPLKYMMWLTEGTVEKVAEALGWSGTFTAAGTNELILGSMINDARSLATAQTAAAAAGASAASVFIINFDFFGIDLSQTPQLKFWANGLSWGAIGLFLLPLISAGLSVVSMFVSQKTNQMNRDQKVKMNVSMILMGPLISLWIGFVMPAGLCIYWISNSLLGMVQEVICGRMLRKDYEAAQKEMEEQQRKAKEAEKERRRKSAEKKAAALAAGKSGKKQPESKKDSAVASASRVGLRTYARGRAYDPDRYPVTPYRDPNGSAGPVAEVEPEELTEEETLLLAEPNPELTAQAEKAAEAPDTVDEGGYEEAYSEDEED